MITEKQKQLIEYMNEFCREKFDLENNHSKKRRTRIYIKKYRRIQIINYR